MTESDHPAEETESEWNATWAGTERAQLEAALAATPEQRLAWLEAVMRLAHACGALRPQAGCRTESPPSEND